MRAAAAGVVALALSLAACGGSSKPHDPALDVTHDQVLQALSRNTEFGATTPTELGCIADVLLQFEPPDDLLQFVNGEAANLPEPPDATARQEIVVGVDQCSMDAESARATASATPTP